MLNTFIAMTLLAGCMTNSYNAKRMNSTEDCLWLDYNTMPQMNVTQEEITHRHGYLIEKVIGICNDENTGDGKILGEPVGHNYISYSSVDGVETGDVVVTYLIFSNTNQYEDDIIERIDLIMDSNWS